MKIIYILSAFIIIIHSTLQAQYSLEGTIYCRATKQPIDQADVLLNNSGQLLEDCPKGRFQFTDLAAGEYHLTFFAEGFLQQNITVNIDNKDFILDITLDSLAADIETIVVNAEEMRHLRAIEGMAIYASKKTELIDCQKLTANLSNNNSRQVYAKVAGLNIWENDNSGIQLNIGARGLNPNRTSNFNTRQNGYDISADALGYPESYYTPPTQAVQRIEVVRGAASLQYGTQFGGLLNFVMQRGSSDKKLEWVSENTYGLYNFFSTFNSIGGTVAKGKLNYYGFYLYKRGDGWRPFSGYNAHNAYVALSFAPNERWTIRAEQTFMSYLAQQPGGLTDAEFQQDPRQAKRPRNWFKVDWKISSLSLFHQFSPCTQLQSNTFLLVAGRQALGNLQPINRADYGDNRNLIKGTYLNIGNETRLMHRYRIKQQQMVFLTGLRLYKGLTTQRQGFSNADSTGSRSDFDFLPINGGILQSDYRFPSFNMAVFAENWFNITPRWSITPGMRYEFIQTASDGYYQDMLVVQGQQGMDTLKNEKIYEKRNRPRHIFLAGMGTSYRPVDNVEIYANFSQNYRAITFNDLRIVNPNQVIDSLLRDEHGFNADLGFRGNIRKFFTFDVSLFLLSYQRRIGTLQSSRPNAENPLIIEPYTLVTNIGNARVFGIETLIEADIWRLIRGEKSKIGLSVFCNFAWLDGRYTKTANSYAANKQLEFVAPITLRTGLSFAWQGLRLSYQCSYTHRHFTDATNAESSANAVVGVIPSYSVMDLTASYTWRWMRWQVSISNLANARYFTRRAASYPGPGIIPADGITFYISLQTRLGLPVSKK